MHRRERRFHRSGRAVLFTVCAWGSTAVGAAGACAQTAGDAGPPHEPLGIAVYDSRTRDAIRALEDGRPDDAVESLRELTRRPRDHAPKQLNELRLGLGLVLLRAGEPADARKVLLPLSRVKDDARLSRRARVLCDMASRRRQASSDAPALESPRGWRDALLHAVDAAALEVVRRHEALLRLVRERRWAEATDALDAARSQLDLLSVFDLPEAESRRAACLAGHARELAAAVREVNSAMALMSARATELADQMTQRTDRATGRRGYLPVERVAAYNQVVDQVAAADVLGERLVGEFQRVVGESDGRLDRDSSVRISRTKLPEKRPVFTQY